VDADDRWCPVEFLQRVRFLKKAASAPGKLLGMVGRDREHCGAAFTEGDRRWQVFLDGHFMTESQVQCPIGDAEGSFAEDTLQLISTQLGSCGNPPRMSIRSDASPISRSGMDGCPPAPRSRIPRHLLGGP